MSNLFVDPRGPVALFVEDGLAQEAFDLVQGNAKASAVDRVSVYADAYFLRLKEILDNDFELLHLIMGDSAFHDLAVEYLTACPPYHANANFVSARLAQFMSLSPVWSANPFNVSIAKLEWLINESIFEPWVDDLSVDELAKMSTNLETAVFVTDPSVRFLETSFNIEELWFARGESSLPQPSSMELPWLVLHRGLGSMIKFHRMSHESKHVFDLLSKGLTLLEVCEQIEETPGFAQAMSSLGDWTRMGLIKTIKTETSL